MSLAALPRPVRHAGAGLLTLPDRAASLRPPTFEHLLSQLPSAEQGDHPRFRGWLSELGFADTPRFRYDRKIWEWCYILEAFSAVGCWHPFGGPWPSAWAGSACPPSSPRVACPSSPRTRPRVPPATGPVGQHAAPLDELRCDEVCPPARFERLVSFRAVDMTDIPADLTGFDVLWSSCAFEHLGSAAAGADFALKSMDCLRPGGLAVHTTVIRVDGGPDLELPGTVLYSVDTLRRLVARLRLRGTSCWPTTTCRWSTCRTASSTNRPTRTSPTT